MLHSGILNPTSLEDTQFNIAFTLSSNDDRLANFNITYEGFVELEVKMNTFDYSTYPPTFTE